MAERAAVRRRRVEQVTGGTRLRQRARAPLMPSRFEHQDEPPLEPAEPPRDDELEPSSPGSPEEAERLPELLLPELALRLEPLDRDSPSP